MVNTKPDMSVTIGRMRMKDPVTVASGTFGFGQEMVEFFDLSLLGAITVKGTSLEPWQGNDYPRTVETPSGMLNAIGLQNDGIDAFLEEKLPFLRDYKDLPVIVNIVGHTIEEYASLAQLLAMAEGVSAIEINVSCPNVKEGCMIFGSTPEGTASVVKAVRAQTSLTLITKLSPNFSNMRETARAAVDAGSDAVSLVNTFLATAIDPWKRKFRLANVTGGLSGPAIKPIALRMVYELAQEIEAPIIGMGGIMNAMDAVEFLLAGATAVAMGTANFVNPMIALDVISGIEDYLVQTGASSVYDIIGQVER